MKTLRRYFANYKLFLAVLALAFLALTTYSFAQDGTWYMNSSGELRRKTFNEQYLSSDNQPCTKLVVEGNGNIEQVQGVCGQGALQNLFSTISSGLVGETKIEVEDGEIASIDHSRGLSDQVIALAGNFYTEQPIESTQVQAKNFVKDITEDLRLVTPTYAQESTVYFPGWGYNILRPIQSFWSVNKNVAYGLLIIIVMVVALLVLFRRESGQQVITVVNSLPSIILSLLLITFSYAISGLFIDLITVGTNFVQYVLVASPGSPGYNTIWNGGTQIIYEDGVPRLWHQAEQVGENLVNNEVGEFGPLDGKYGIQADDPLMSVWLVFGTADLNLSGDDLLTTDLVPQLNVIETIPIIGGVVNSLTRLIPDGSSSADGLSSLAAQIANLVFTLALFMASIRIFFKLMSAYITLILFPIVSPYMFLIAAMPTMLGNMIGAFLKPMFAASLKFIVTYAVFLLIVVITYEPLIQSFSFVPPLLGYDPSTSVETSGRLVKILIAYGLYLATPVILDKVSELAQAGDGGGAFGEAISNQTKASAGQLYSLIAGAFSSFNRKRYPERR
ncbi:hypothetical protein KC717_01205 [Candidatus Dojkabacteria bacterium]|uniref:Type IV secretion system protein n=1 Tax=Candidatus Dojkabacteria bacterium TaxID=2099670 RepID=A0A955L803_9BACT|nr:hypothetical protein [Candidatus Dojkabacteria bacterium]